MSEPANVYQILDGLLQFAKALSNDQRQVLVDRIQRTKTLIKALPKRPERPLLDEPEGSRGRTRGAPTKGMRKAFTLSPDTVEKLIARAEQLQISQSNLADMCLRQVLGLGEQITVVPVIEGQQVYKKVE